MVTLSSQSFRFGKFQVRRKLISRESFGPNSNETERPAPGLSTLRWKVVSLNFPSAEKSSHRSLTFEFQPFGSNSRLKVMVFPAPMSGVDSAMVPHALALRSTLSEVM